MEEARYQVLRRLAPNLRSEFYTALNKQVLIRHPFFAAMPEKPLMRLCEVAEAVLFRSGEIVCRRGHAAETAFFIVTGELVIVFDEDNDLQGINKFDESLVGQIRISV